MYQFFPYIIVLFLSFSILISLSIYGWHYKENIGVKEFVLAMLASAWWVFCQGFELMAATLPIKLFWANIEYIGAGLSTFAYLMLAMRFSGKDKFLTKRNIGFILMIFAVFFGLVFTDTYHGLMRRNFSLNVSSIPYTIDKEYGALYPLYLLFTYSINVTSLLLLFITALKKDAIYRKQATILLLGLGIIALSNITYILGLAPVKRFDLAPALFGLSGSVIFWGIFHHKLLNIMPVARDLLVERMSNGVVVSDRSNVIIDINHSAVTMLHLDKEEMIGRNIDEIPFLVKHFPIDITKEQQTTIRYEYEDKMFIYELNTLPFKDKKEKRAGTLYMLNDITEQRKNIEEIIQQQKTLSVMNERERLGRELHDGLGQMFGYVNAQAQTVKEYMVQQKNIQAMEKLEDLIRVSRDAHGDIREYILEMRGIAPKNRSFSVTLKQYAINISEKHGISIEIYFDDNLPPNFPDEEKGIQLLKIIQEALNNTRKHAGTCSVTISFITKENAVEIKIADNGKGFDISKQSGIDQYGLSIIRERAEEIGTDIVIQSEIGVGTEIILRLTLCEGVE